MTKTTLFLSFLALIHFTSCKNNDEQFSNEMAIASSEIDSNIELEKWKNELLSQKKIGNSCQFQEMGDSAFFKWQKDNPTLSDGLPIDSAEYNFAKADFDGDNKDDLLMYFNASNCTGYNGGVPSYAKIVFANGTSNSELMNEIMNAITKQYDIQKIYNKKLKPITNSYMELTTTINYKDNIYGECSLYTKEDAHCCPSYSVAYSYDVISEKMDLKITSNSN